MDETDETLPRGAGPVGLLVLHRLVAVRIIGQLTTAGEDKIAPAAQPLAA
jgi:hypothetical protein